MRYIFPYVFVLVYWLLFFISIAVPTFAYYALALLGAWSVVTVGVINGRQWYRHWNMWANFVLFMVSSFFFSLIMVSPALRQSYVMFGGILSGILTYMLLRFISTANPFLAKSYLLVISFTHIITFWQASALLYFMTLYDAKLLPSLILFALLTFLLGRGTILDHGLKKSSTALVLVVLVLTTAEFSMVLSLLPVHYYILATILTMWFFYVIEMVIAGQEVSSRKALFKKYTLLLIAAIITLLATTTWQ